MPLISLDDDDQRWVPTHVNAIVLRARGLRTKSKQGSRYVYTIVQVGKEKYTTGLVEKASEPEWNEECSFELLPGLLEAGPGACPPGNSNLVFTVMHRVLIGLDVFLGQAVVPLDKVFQDRMCPRSEWLKLHSKAGRKEKERGELQVTIRFTRNNMTASMYDLSVQEKPRSAFGRLKERVTGKKRVADVESSSAILPGRYAALSSSASQTFAEDGQGEMPGEEESGDERKSKMKDFFLKGKLKKSSDTHSCSSLASESSATSSAGDPFVPIELSSTPIYSSRVMEPFRTNSEGGGKVPEVMTHKRAYSDEASKIATASRSCPAVENLKGQGMPLSKSTLCINGSHIYTSEPVSPKSGLPVKRTLLEKCSPLSRSLQNLTRRGDDSQKADRRCGSIDGSRKEAEREAEGPAALGAVGLEGKPMQATAPMAAASGGMEGKKLKRTLFSSGRSDSLPAKHEQGQASGPQEGRLRGWFGSSDTQVKSRLGVSSKVDRSPDTSSSLPPCLPNLPPSSLPVDSATGHVSPSSLSSHIHSFTHPSPPSPSISLSNPFLTRLQRNPFFEELIAEEALKSPPACYTSSPFSPTHLAFPPRPGLPSPARGDMQNQMASIKRERPQSVARQRSLPALMAATPEIVNSNNINACRSSFGNVGEWDDFEAFATSRLKSPTGTPTQQPPPLLVPSGPNPHPVVNHILKPKNGIGIEEVSEGTPRYLGMPPLPPRKHTRTEVPVRERSSDSWLNRAQELAIQKEACLLYQTDLASLQQLRETGSQVSPVDKDSSHCADQELNINVHALSHTAQRPRDENRNILEGRGERVLANGGFGPSLAGSNGGKPVENGPTFGFAQNIAPQNEYEGIQENTESDHTVPNMPMCQSDDTTVSESLCSFFVMQSKPESPCELNSTPKLTCSPQNENITNSGDIIALSARDSNNNTNDPSQFAFIDSDSSRSDLKQSSFGMMGKNSKKASTQCHNASALESLGNVLLLCRSFQGNPEDLQNKMNTEPVRCSPNKPPGQSPVCKDISQQVPITAVTPTNDHLKSFFFEEPCDSLKGPGSSRTKPKESISDLKDISSVFACQRPPSDCNVTNVSGYYKESSVTSQTASRISRDDGSTTAQLKPEATEDNPGFDAVCAGGGCLTELKTKVGELEAEEKTDKGPLLENCEMGMSFKDLHARVAPQSPRSPFNPEVRSARIRTRSTSNSPKADPGTVSSAPVSDIDSSRPHSLLDLPWHGSVSPSSCLPAGMASHQFPDPAPAPAPDPIPTSLICPQTATPGTGSTLPGVPFTASAAQPQVTARHTLCPEEAQPTSGLPPLEESSPHPVKPLITVVQGEKRSEGRSVLEKLRSSIHPGRSAQQAAAEPEKTQVWMSEARAHYQTLTNMELIALLLQQELEAEHQRAESELQATLLERREAELRKLKVQVRDLEDYIDKLLVRIMEQTPTLLQVRARPK
ncbi:hypothetical protein P4O66_020432 [Electrophorus voltai]|uniref:C2 domain-containing protein n=1 Tax=Electrophorus voltai TaxID=2609070 RepID=A0AAD8ZUB2_9TELE|nr:hypothetical protein P4O66_020432 [Electrophorus voltai]